MRPTAPWSWDFLSSSFFGSWVVVPLSAGLQTKGKSLPFPLEAMMGGLLSWSNTSCGENQSPGCGLGRLESSRRDYKFTKMLCSRYSLHITDPAGESPENRGPKKR